MCITNGNNVSNNGQSWLATVAVHYSADSRRTWARPNLGPRHRAVGVPDGSVNHYINPHNYYAQWVNLYNFLYNAGFDVNVIPLLRTPQILQRIIRLDAMGIRPDCRKCQSRPSFFILTTRLI